MRVGARRGVQQAGARTEQPDRPTDTNAGMSRRPQSEPHFDPYAAAADAVRGGASSGHRLVVVAFIDRWAPHAYATAMALDALRTGGDIAFASIFIIDALADRDAAHDAGVLTGPGGLLSCLPQARLPFVTIFRHSKKTGPGKGGLRCAQKRGKGAGGEGDAQASRDA